MLRGAISGALCFCVLFGCGSTNVGRIDRVIQKSEYKKSVHREEIVKFIYQLEDSASCKQVKQLLEQKQFKFTEQVEKRTRIDGKELSRVKKIHFWDTIFPGDRYTLLFDCENEADGRLKAAYFGVSEVRVFAN